MAATPQKNNRWYSLEGKKFWVTGGAGYLGSPSTIELDRVGAEVLCFDLPGKAAALVRDQQLKRTTPLDIDINQQYPDFIKDLSTKNVMQRIGHNHEIVGPTLFLLTDSASYMTRLNLLVGRELDHLVA